MIQAKVVRRPLNVEDVVELIPPESPVPRTALPPKGVQQVLWQPCDTSGHVAGKRLVDRLKGRSVHPSKIRQKNPARKAQRFVLRSETGMIGEEEHEHSSQARVRESRTCRCGARDILRVSIWRSRTRSCRRPGSKGYRHLPCIASHRKRQFAPVPGRTRRKRNWRITISDPR